jgi:hypothetical protein
MSDTFGFGEIIVIIFNLLLLCIPVILVWLLIKTLRKISRQNEQIEQELIKLREEIQSLREKSPGGSPN